MAQPTITMYVRQDCTDVYKVRYLLKKRGLAWDEIDIDWDKEGLAKVEGWNNGRSPTPTLWIGDQLLVEPTAAELDKALASTGD